MPRILTLIFVLALVPPTAQAQCNMECLQAQTLGLVYNQANTYHAIVDGARGYAPTSAYVPGYPGTYNYGYNPYGYRLPSTRERIIEKTVDRIGDSAQYWWQRRVDDRSERRRRSEYEREREIDARYSQNNQSNEWWRRSDERRDGSRNPDQFNQINQRLDQIQQQLQRQGTEAINSDAINCAIETNKPLPGRNRVKIVNRLPWTILLEGGRFVGEYSIAIPNGDSVCIPRSNFTVSYELYDNQGRHQVCPARLKGSNDGSYLEVGIANPGNASDQDCQEVS